jgi:hypothetical protein
MLVLTSAAVARDQRLERLNDPAYSVRREAFVELLTDQSMTVQSVRDLYAQATTPEQRHRLLDVARHHLLRNIMREKFADSARGSLGFTLNPLPAASAVAGVEHPAIVVVLTLPGFPAFAYLEPGDLIVGIDGRPIPDTLAPEAVSTYFTGRVKEHKPAEHIELDLVRQGRKVRVRFAVAPYEALEEFFDERATRFESPGRLKASYQRLWLEQYELLRQLDEPQEPLSVVPPAP